MVGEKDRQALINLPQPYSLYSYYYTVFQHTWMTEHFSDLSLLFLRQNVGYIFNLFSHFFHYSEFLTG